MRFACRRGRLKSIKRKGRSTSAAVLVEAVVSTCILLPIIILTIWAWLEISYAYIIGMNMTEAANLASRALAAEYFRDPSVARDLAKQNRVLSRIRIDNMVASNTQFTIPDGGWQIKKAIFSSPESVTVICTYIPGEGDPPLPKFPNPDPLNLRDKVNISSSATAFIY
ncbi:MAG: hypothetical protein WCT03_13150 [Candidatus Obscuribacterales bacterium]